MALKKSKQIVTGHTGEYWVAESINNKRANKTEVSVMLFKDQQAREAGSSMMDREDVGDMDGCYKTGEEIYNFIKQTEFFSDAEDI